MKANQIDMAMKNRQSELAMQMASKKEGFKYYTIFVGTLFTVLPIAAFKTHNPKLLVPLVPMSFGWTFQFDMYYGNLLLRARKEASRMIKEEPERFFLPQGNGMIDQTSYNKIIGIPENYRPRIN